MRGETQLGKKWVYILKPDLAKRVRQINGITTTMKKLARNVFSKPHTFVLIDRCSSSHTSFNILCFRSSAYLRLAAAMFAMSSLSSNFKKYRVLRERW
mmetsp:Transcript_15482/g.18654  ORF Transcript_15482/g.18654 Transcript_15482/m.18654 type:complete len:98 (+) Transcript_15482:99-392(+)